MGQSKQWLAVVFCVGLTNSLTSYASLVDTLDVLQSLYQQPKRQEWTPPSIQSTQINGLKGLWLVRPEPAIVDIQLTFDAGSARDASEQRVSTTALPPYGLAHLAAQLLAKGTSEQSAEQIAEQWRVMGARYQARVYRDLLTIQVRVPAHQSAIDGAITQMIKLCNKANFPTRAQQQQRNNVNIGQQQSKENPTAAMQVQLYRALYGQHPYAQPTTGTLGGLATITQTDLINFRQHYLVANNATVAITGAIDSQQAYAMIQRFATELAAGQPAPPLPPVSRPDFQVIILPYAGQQAYVLIGSLAMPRRDTRRIPLQIANHVLGGSGFSSQLMQVMREQHGLSYTVSSDLTSLQQSGVWQLSYATAQQPEQQALYRSLAIVRDAMAKLARQPLDESTLNFAKNSLLNAQPKQWASNEQANAQLSVLGFYPSSVSALAQRRHIESTTAQQVQQAWSDTIRPEHLVVIIAAHQVDQKRVEQLFNRPF